MDHRKSYALFWGGIWSALLLALVYFCTHWVWIAVVAVVAMVAAVFQTTIFYRCPRCKKSLDPRTKKPEYCPHCGEKLDT